MRHNAYTHLREQELAKCTKPFLAKGKSVKRCQRCQLADFACLCNWRPPAEGSNAKFVLIMHRLELFKPTNTGRLIADVINDTEVYLWHRLEPPKGLLTLLSSREHACFLVFPCNEHDARPRQLHTALPVSAKKPVFILLDGSWKQCSRMVALSRWLDGVPSLTIPDEQIRTYRVRDSGRADRFSTAEAAINCLTMAGESSLGKTLQNYYGVFNEHYLATRGCYKPALGQHHEALG